MTKWTTTLGAALFVVAGGAAKAAEVDVKVPFPFMVEGHQLPAGAYRVIADESDSSVMMIKSQHGPTTGVWVLTTPAAGKDPAGDEPALTFSRYENEYRLNDIWDGSGRGHEVHEPAKWAQAKTQTQTKAQAPAQAPAKHASTSTHATRGVVKSVEGDTIVITRSDASQMEMTFMMNPSTHKEGTLSVGQTVSVRYREEGKNNIATAISVQTPKKMASHAAPHTTTTKH